MRVTRVYFDDPLQNATQNQIQIQREGHSCSYATVMESKAFNFSTTYLTSTAFYDRDNASVPVVMEWGITAKNCEDAKLDKEVPYACVATNSQCNKAGAGYACTCSHGYEGNPYPLNGCKGSFPCPMFPVVFSLKILLYFL